MATVAPRPGSDRRAALVDELLALLPALGRRLKASLAADLREQIHVTHLQLEMVGCLAASADGLTMTDLARAQGCALSTATAMADRLLKQGLIERVADPRDRRLVRLVPTARAMELRDRFRAAKREAAMAALESLDVEEMTTLVALLGKVADGAGEELQNG